MANTYKGGNCYESAAGKPSLGFGVTEPHRKALGHFAQEKFLREGHNYVPVKEGEGGYRTPTAPRVTGKFKYSGKTASPRQITKLAKAGMARAVADAGNLVRGARVQRRANVLAAKAAGDTAGVRAARKAGRADVAAARRANRITARAAKKSGGARLNLPPGTKAI